MADAAGVNVKEVIMDLDTESQVGGDGITRKRRRGAGSRRRRRVQKDGNTGGVQEEDTALVAVDKVQEAAPQALAASIKKPVAAIAPKVVISAPKKKAAKIMLVPKKIHVIARPQKTFKAKRIRLTIDNTAKTQKRRRMTLARVDAMTEEQLRETAVSMKLSRIETVKKVPVDLLRQMLKDYYTMRGMLL